MLPMSTIGLDVLLCDHAEVAGGKLFINGAAIDRMELPPNATPPFQAQFTVAGIVRVPWTATNVEHRLSFRFITEDGNEPELPEGANVGSEGIGGEMRFNVGRPPHATSGQEQLVPFAFSFQGLPLMRTGRYVVVLSLDGSEVRRVWFVVSQQQPSGFTLPPVAT